MRFFFYSASLWICCLPYSYSDKDTCLNYVVIWDRFAAAVQSVNVALCFVVSLISKPRTLYWGIEHSCLCATGSEKGWHTKAKAPGGCCGWGGKKRILSYSALFGHINSSIFATLADVLILDHIGKSLSQNILLLSIIHIYVLLSFISLNRVAEF